MLLRRNMAPNMRARRDRPSPLASASAPSDGATAKPHAASAPAVPFRVALIGSSGGSTHRGDARSEVSALRGQLGGIALGGRRGYGGAHGAGRVGRSAPASTKSSGATPSGARGVVLSCVVYVEGRTPLDTARGHLPAAVWVMGLPPTAAGGGARAAAGGAGQVASGAAVAPAARLFAALMGSSQPRSSQSGSSQPGSSQPGSLQPSSPPPAGWAYPLQCACRGPLHLSNRVAKAADARLALAISRGEIDALVMVSADPAAVNAASVTAAAKAGVPVRAGGGRLPTATGARLSRCRPLCAKPEPRLQSLHRPPP